MSDAIRKVLIVRFSSIGDIVLTTPVVRCLHQQLGVDIHYLTKRAYAPVIAANPYIQKIYTIEKKVSEVLPDLRAEEYDLIVDLHKNLRSLKLWLGLGVRRLTFDKLNWQKWLMVKFRINRLPAMHIVDRYLAAVASLGVVNDQLGLDYFLNAEDQVDIKTWLPILPTPHAPRSTPYVAFVIGAAHATKRLPTDKIISICRRINSSILLVGGPGEAEEGAAIMAAAGSHVVNTCGKLRLNQSASVVQQAQQIISHDTGMMHIAAAFKKPIVSVWGNTIPEFGMYPYYPKGILRNATIEVSGLRCRPCSKIGYASCPQGHFKCMRLIDEVQLTAFLTKNSGDEGVNRSYL